MKLSNLMAAKAVICLVFGVGMVLVPVQLFSLDGLTLDPGPSAIAQLLGAAFLLLSIMLWFAKNAPSTDVALKAIVLAFFVGDTIGFIVSLWAQINGVMNSFGWLTVVIYLLFALGFGYFQLIHPVAESGSTRPSPMPR